MEFPSVVVHFGPFPYVLNVDRMEMFILGNVGKLFSEKWDMKFCQE